jgi:hypothetical protein
MSFFPLQSVAAAYTLFSAIVRVADSSTGSRVDSSSIG